MEHENLVKRKNQKNNKKRHVSDMEGNPENRTTKNQADEKVHMKNCPFIQKTHAKKYATPQKNIYEKN